MLVCLALDLCAGAPRRPPRSTSLDCFTQWPGRVRQLGRGEQAQHGFRAVQVSDQQTREQRIKTDAGILAFETAKFNLLWTKMKEAEEAKSQQFEALKREVKEQGQVVEELGGSLPAEMMTLEEAAAKAAKLKAELSFEKLWSMSNEERWILAQGLGPAFPISLVLAYTAYWALNVPFIAYAYFATVATGQTSMAVVMAGAYATSVPFKPLVYIGALLGTAWTADNVMPLIAKLFNFFKLPDESDWDRL